MLAGGAVFIGSRLRQPGFYLGGGAFALRHLEGGYGMAVAVDDGEPVLQCDLMLAQDLVDGFAALPG